MEKNIMKRNFPSIIREINFKFQIKDTKIETFSKRSLSNQSATYTILVIHRNTLIDEDDNGNKW